jgi:hypothetical protein
MATRTSLTPSDIPVIQVKISGYASSASSETALHPTGLPECERSLCGLRGDRTPNILSSHEAMKRAEAIATALEEAEEWRQGHQDGRARALGHVFFVSLTGGIAVPPPRIATAMGRGTASEIWEELRPYAEEDDIHGIDLPIGRVIFREAQAGGHYEEKLITSLPSLKFSGVSDTDSA